MTRKMFLGKGDFCKVKTIKIQSKPKSTKPTKLCRTLQLLH